MDTRRAGGRARCTRARLAHAGFAQTRRDDAAAAHRQHGASHARHAAQALFGLACLPLRGVLQPRCDAALHRAHRRAAQASRVDDRERNGSASRTGLAATYRTMWSAPATALAAGMTSRCARPDALVVAAPLMLLWCAAPAIAWWVSRPARREPRRSPKTMSRFSGKSRAERGVLRDFVVAGRSLPAARQLSGGSGRAVAHRTSPTNMGMALLANVAAYDFGYIWRRAVARAHRACIGTCEPRTLPGAFLQLVQHADARAACAALCLDRWIAAICPAISWC